MSKDGGAFTVEEMQRIVITPPKFEGIQLTIIGTAPYMQARFSEKARAQIEAKQRAGSTAKKDKRREPRDFDADYQNAFHIATEGWYGIPASAFRNAAIDACRMVGYQMTRAKMSIFIEPEGFDRADGMPLVQIYGQPEMTQMPVRNETGVCDIRVRPMWREWRCMLNVRYDADQFTAQDVVNLFLRAGLQVGIGEGRPFSKNSNGLGFGLFTIE